MAENGLRSRSITPPRHHLSNDQHQWSHLRARDRSQSARRRSPYSYDRGRQFRRPGSNHHGLRSISVSQEHDIAFQHDRFWMQEQYEARRQQEEKRQHEQRAGLWRQEGFEGNRRSWAGRSRVRRLKEEDYMAHVRDVKQQDLGDDVNLGTDLKSVAKFERNATKLERSSGTEMAGMTKKGEELKGVHDCSLTTGTKMKSGDGNVAEAKKGGTGSPEILRVGDINATIRARQKSQKSM
ncbi:hypothetical protein A2U01_0015624, partial [Trifolium medium]|nr:hypothetical protein [Trifolium medium]